MRNKLPIIYLIISLALFSSAILATQYYFFKQQVKAQNNNYGKTNVSEIDEISVNKDENEVEPVYSNYSDFFEPTHYVVFNFLNVRSEATIYSELKKKLYRGEKVYLFKRIDRDWCQVEIPKFKINGYVACRYLKPIY